MTEFSPVASGLWTDEPAPRLIGGRHRTTGAIVFPMPDGDLAQAYEPYPLQRRGTLWSWTVQRFRPKEPYDGPEDFEPYAVAYVQLGDEIIVESLLTDLEGLEIGMPVELVIVPFDQRRITFAFAPITEG